MEKSFEFVDVHSVVWQCIGDSLTAAPSTAVRPMMLPTGRWNQGADTPLNSSRSTIFQSQAHIYAKHLHPSHHLIFRPSYGPAVPSSLTQLRDKARYLNIIWLEVN